MSHRGISASRFKAKYVELDEQDEDDGKGSVNSRSYLLASSDRDDYDEDVPPKSTTFNADGLETFYKPIEGYEGAHRYDPEYTWSAADEKRVVRKVFLPGLRYIR
jgi:hypothetical protein